MSDSEGRKRINTASKARDALVYDASDALQRKAAAAADMGMMPLARDLWEIAELIKRNAELLHKCYSDEFNAWCDSVQQGSANLLRGVLAGCELGERAAREQ